MAYTVTIETDNAVFDEEDEVMVVALAVTLRQLADRIEQCGCVDQTLMDENGNTIGQAKMDKVFA